MADKEIARFRQLVKMEPGTAYVVPDGRMMISYDGKDVYEYTGPNFALMTLEEINEFIARMEAL